MGKSSKQFNIVFCAIVIVLELFQEVRAHAVKHTDPNPIVYKRYMRRRPSQFTNDLYVDEIVEIFHLKHRPPPQLLSDEQVDLIIRCDFDPDLEECNQLPKSMPPTKSPQIALGRPLPTKPTRPNKPTWPIATTHTTESPTASTTTELWSTTTEEWPFLPEISASREETIGTSESVGEIEDEGNDDYNDDEE